MAYPGGDALLRIEVRFTPYDPSYNAGIGFRVYGQDSAAAGIDQPEGGLVALDWAFEAESPLVVQIYNYTNRTVDFDIEATYPDGTPAMVEEVEAPAVAAPAVVEEVEEPEMDMLPSGVEVLFGNPGGSCQIHTFSHSGEGDLIVIMSFAPDDPSFSSAIVLNIYGSEGALVAKGARGATLGQLSATVSEAGTYSAVVCNYSDGYAIEYSLDSSS
jgi:hypothetical protein